MLSLPVSAVVATRDRPEVFHRTLASLEEQGVLPRELIVVDASADSRTKELLSALDGRSGAECSISWHAAEIAGAAAQRGQGSAFATQPVLWFFDDDILFGPDCFPLLVKALESDSRLGGVNAMISNQRYLAPGRVSRLMFALMAGRLRSTYAGCVIGPAWNLLPEDRGDLAEVVPVEWLNLTCTLYRREALPVPLFASQFTGYSLMEDLGLSLEVGKRWKLANARTARIFHDSQPGSYKSDPMALAEMELVNRHFVMTRILDRNRPVDYAKLFAFELFSLASSARRSVFGAGLWREAYGKLKALGRICVRQ